MGWEVPGLSSVLRPARCLAYWCHGSMSHAVIQELTEDFVGYRQENDMDPNELALDKTTKKDLMEAIDRSLGNTEHYYDLCEDEEVSWT